MQSLRAERTASTQNIANRLTGRIKKHQGAYLFIEWPGHAEDLLGHMNEFKGSRIEWRALKLGTLLDFWVGRFNGRPVAIDISLAVEPELPSRHGREAARYEH